MGGGLQRARLGRVGRLQGLQEARLEVVGRHELPVGVRGDVKTARHRQASLGEARQLMLTEDLDAASAAYRVGYESASQFSREYGRQFGAPPMRDISALRQRGAAPLATP